MVIKNPGTVSKILWHFTGGPEWNSVNNKQKMECKAPSKAFDNLVSILDAQMLKVGNYNEVVKPKINLNQFDTATNQWTNFPNTERHVGFNPVCCLADIPLQHLDYHSDRYGKFAIGFYREKIIGQFHPVFYTLNNSTQILHEFYRLFTTIKNIEHDAWTKINYIEQANKSISEIKNKIKHYNIEDSGLFNAIEKVSNSVKKLENGLNTIDETFRNFGSFFKSFDETEFESIFCEREWRSTSDFYLTDDVIAMLLAPKEGGFYENLIAKFDELIISGKYVKRIPIIPWEDI